MARTAPNPAPAEPTAQPTPAAQWSQGTLYRLPGSGHVARIRQPGLMALVAKGQIPNPIAADVTRLLALTEEPKTDEERLELFERNSRAMVEVAALALVEPRLILDRAPSYERGEIGPADLSDIDLMFIYFNVVEGRADDLTTFRVG